MFGDLRRSRRVAYTAAFIGLITLGGWISVPFVPVPFTLQTFFVLLAAAVMKRDAVIPVTLYVALGALGLPVFHNGIAGFGVLLGPTGGYLLGFIPAACSPVSCMNPMWRRSGSRGLPALPCSSSCAARHG